MNVGKIEFVKDRNGIYKYRKGCRWRILLFFVSLNLDFFVLL